MASREDTTPLRSLLVVNAIAAATPPAVWCGWSLGGLFALHAAATPPGGALAMIAATPRFVWSDDWPHAVEPAVFEQFGREPATDSAAPWNASAPDVMARHTPARSCARCASAWSSAAHPPNAPLLEGLRLLESTDCAAHCRRWPSPACGSPASVTGRCLGGMYCRGTGPGAQARPSPTAAMRPSSAMPTRWPPPCNTSLPACHRPMADNERLHSAGLTHGSGYQRPLGTGLRRKQGAGPGLRARWREGVNVVIGPRRGCAAGRRRRLRALPGAAEVRAVAADVTTEAGRAPAWPRPQVDILVTNAGGPPPGDFRASSATTGSPRWTPTCWRRSR
jgi:hypothetical protein